MTDQNTEATPAPNTAEERAQANVNIALANPDMVPDKFKSADGSVNGDALLQSYLHMERMASGQNQQIEDPTPASEQTTSDAAESSTTTTDSPDDSSSPESLAEAMEGKAPPPGADLWALAQEQIRAAGNVDEAVLNGLREQGVPDVALAAMANGIKAQQKADMDAAHEACGGKEGFDATIKWAKDNLPAQEQAAITEAFKGPNAVLVLQGLYARAMGAGAIAQPSGQVNTGVGGTAIAPNPDSQLPRIESPQDMQALMRDPKYRSDAEYRRKVDKAIMQGAGVPSDVLRQL